MNCRECRGPRGPVLRRQWGCDRELDPNAAPHFLDLTLLGMKGREPITRCPAITTPAWAFEATTLFSGWRKGLLPIPGAISDQGAWYLAAMGLLDQVMAAIAEREESDG